MLLWLNGSDNSRWSPNENYAREMMELFTLGAGRGYTETDVREQARALTGFRNDWRNGVGDVNFRYDPKAHDPGMKTIFKHRGAFTWKDSVRLAVANPNHPSFFVRKLWSYFIPGTPGRRDRARARAPLRLERVRREARRRRDPQAPRALHGRPPGEVAGRLHRRAPAPARPRHRHDRVGVARQHGRAAALLSAERRRLGRHALARHGDVARPLVDRAVRAAAVRARSRQGRAAVRRCGARRQRARVLAPPGADELDARGAPRPSPRTRSPTRARSRGSASSTP